jgi:hypothetical protein
LVGLRWREDATCDPRAQQAAPALHGRLVKLHPTHERRNDSVLAVLFRKDHRLTT